MAGVANRAGCGIGPLRGVGVCQMTALTRRTAHWACLAGASTVLLLASLSTGRASALALVECQHPLVTGVEVYHLHHITSHSACPVAMALFRWENAGGNGSNYAKLYGCKGLGHAYLRMHTFKGWHLALKPEFVMSRGGASFAVTGTDFPISCT